ncbi:MAG: 2-oxoacid:acceptor oxidoreductase family protein [Flavobacteriales bacterium]|jgi:indolepyruvate ferredoxin oxidoreductase beta subunit|nr:2-oxoacid:acceptor oxidoreductase family protein [Flavobacteriales bacterium]
MTKTCKIQIAGVGGQGVVYLTKLLVEAALIADIPVATSEIHGLSQRGGSVNAGVTFGKNTYGFIEEAGADFLLGLEALEAQRCVNFLNTTSKVVIDNNRILPYSVNAEMAEYPDTDKFVAYLQKHVSEVVFIDAMPKELLSISRNVFVAGCASQMDSFPVSYEHLEQAIKATSKSRFAEKSLQALRLGKEYVITHAIQ